MFGAPSGAERGEFLAHCRLSRKGGFCGAQLRLADNARIFRAIRRTKW